MSQKLFGTDGVRGLANVDPMTPQMALALGQALALHTQGPHATKRIVIGKDTRISSYMLEMALASGVCSMGAQAILLGPVPTPGVAFITKAMRADAGVMISASHNPYADNGIKLFDRFGYKLSLAQEAKIEESVLLGLGSVAMPTGKEIGRATRVDDALGRYTEMVKKSFPSQLSLEGIKIVVDAAHGAAYKIAGSLFWELGAEVVTLAAQPDGFNINHQVGALFPEGIAKKVIETGANIGVALDGDADRVILCDEKGQFINGDQLMALCARSFLQFGHLPQKAIVGTIMTNKGVEQYLKDLGIDLIRTPVGDRFVIEEMRAKNLVLGGEPSGHIIFSDHTTTGDGLIASLQVLAVMKRESQTLSQLAEFIPLYPQRIKNVRIRERKDLAQIRGFTDCQKQVEDRLQNKGRLVVRYSGTEPLLRIMVEAQSHELIDEALHSMMLASERYLDVVA